ncbi:MAG: hypothetical protein V1825_04470 [Candidatus Falkowbacteria bacterium]
MRYALCVMRNKQAIIILSIILLIGAMFFAVLFFNKQKRKDTVLEREVFNTQEIVDIKNQGQELSPIEKKQQMAEDLNKLSDAEEQERITNLTEEEKEELKQEILEDLKKLSE